MKKIIFVCSLILLFSILFNNKNNMKEKVIEETRGVFISYIEIEEYLKDKSDEDAINIIQRMIQNVIDFGLNTIVLQVRPCSDAIYSSSIFPRSIYLGNTTLDVLDTFISICHKNDIRLIAWINPYRIQTVENMNLINERHPAYPYLDTDIIYHNGGLYYNPARGEVTDIIMNGVLEVLDYSIDGMLFDDYFYPSDDIDEAEYLEYSKTHTISLEDFHLMIINEMVSKVYSLCQKKNISFGISPEGNIDNNYQHNYADVLKWMKDDGYIDFIMPQIYYGFHNSVRPFLNTSKEWENNLYYKDYYVALAFYKVGLEDNYAKDGRYEWINSSDIIMREIITSRSIKNYRGFVLFRYDNLYNTEYFTDTSQLEINNVKSLLKKD